MHNAKDPCYRGIIANMYQKIFAHRIVKLSFDCYEVVFVDSTTLISPKCAFNRVSTISSF